MFAKRCLTIAAAIALASSTGEQALADEPGDELLPDLTFDRVDTNDRVWRLSDFVPTAGSPGPSSPTPVYIQFGFMSCAPCHVLAERAGDVLGAQVELAYAHLDDVELDEGAETLPQLWTRLYAFMQANSAYEGFVGLRRGNTGLMRLLTGSEAAPAALLVRSDGTYTVLVTPSEAEAAAAFAELLEGG